MATQSSWIIEATAENFAAEVLERSKQTLVVVDFWATWCQPCRLLAPILEKLAVEYEGKFVLVKADTDKLGDIAGGFGVQSIPAVFAVRDANMVDQFVGVLPEPELRAWLDRLLPSEAETLIAEAQALAAEDPAAAEAKYRAVLQLAPQEAAIKAVAKIGLAELLLAAGKLDETLKLVEELESRGFLEPAAQRVKAELDMRRLGTSAGTIDDCRARLAKTPDDPRLQLELAQALAAVGEYESALVIGLKLVQQHRKQFGEPARQLMVDVFQVLPADSELTSIYRRQLSAALY
jgi:putative thioredoxin